MKSNLNQILHSYRGGISYLQPLNFFPVSDTHFWFDGLLVIAKLSGKTLGTSFYCKKNRIFPILSQYEKLAIFEVQKSVNMFKIHNFTE